MTLSEIIKTYRQKNRLTMQEFADRAHLSKGYVSMLEKGRHPKNNKPIVPSLETMFKIAAVLGVTIDELFNSLDGQQLVEIPATVAAEQQNIMINNSMSAVEILQDAFERTGYYEGVTFTEDEIQDIMQFAHFLIMKRGNK